VTIISKSEDWNEISRSMRHVDFDTYPPHGIDICVYCPGDPWGDFQVVMLQWDIDGEEWVTATGTFVREPVTHWRFLRVPC